MSDIKMFVGEYEFLSNFYPCTIYRNGWEFGSSEALFQACKCANIADVELFVVPCSASRSKRIGKKVALISRWESKKVKVMENVLRLKFQDPELRDKLIATGDKILEEGNTWGDKFWGIDIKTGEGKNMLGKLLMKVRDDLK